MRTAELVNLTYFLFLTLVALVWNLPARSKKKVVLVGSIGILLDGAGVFAGGWLRDGLPVPLMALAYWQSGCFFNKPNAALQEKFERSERYIMKLLQVDFAAWAGTRVGTWLELAYALCYPVVPLGLVALYLAGFSDRADDYWTVVLLSAYPCYVLLPLIQLLPPRLVEERPRPTRQIRLIRHFNLWLVRHVTHEANTFPSGHVAASAAIAMVLTRFTLPAGILFGLIAIGIAFGCIVGRYHYAVDVGAAILLSTAVFSMTVLLS